ncbi:Kef-type K+ transport system, membrane component KefB [Tissierella praeacuta DSM 18095]|uniref:Kef-type K+ transport system, membrane component KefB n=1 Tax=Tissierella praeacuta DSM 18095 TaxID=1123404 RepID=A0A1M4WV47_9FIRM|nr:cation:proton antiporter [Tissierella praeacuta]TCU75797.1 Kef-type K+ transport system membrane component KefB [Tissierella praeacuta]SHE84933.1 Kef-type K+ transport system, membrane component KefB [Tissierella praeacuta DSM 18095]SUP00456.1 potassium/proton antiporter [Tissierella praeacuta]
MNNLFSQFNDITIILISLSAMLLSGFLLTRITKILRLPNVSGYIIAGILLGPYVLNIIPINRAKNMGFIGDIALSFIAFDVGKFLKRELFKKTGIRSIIITLFESLLAGIIVSISMHYIFSLDWSFSLLLGAIATSTAPASTMMTINQYKARGEFVNILLQVVALDDVVCLIIFSIIIAFINTTETGNISPSYVILPIIYNIGALGVGFLFAIILSKLLTPNRSNDNRLILAIALLLGISGLCSIFDISPLLSCMVFGATYINTTQDKDLYRQINNFTPPVLSLFFIISGINLDISSLGALGLVGIAYFLIRIIGKYIGAYLGCFITSTDKKICNYLGLALIPQAGVSIGLAFLGQRILPVDIGNRMMTIILASSVLYELVGPACAKLALIYSEAIKEDKIKSLDKI